MGFQKLITEPIDRRLIDKLQSLMDPQSDNSYLDVEQFLLAGKQWLSHVRGANQDEIENR